MSQGRVAPIAKIIPFSAVDGPGCRTAVFVQGCNFFCGYCHNPETRKMCNHCGECLCACPSGALSQNAEEQVVWHEDKCSWCDSCINVCRNSANPRINYMTAEQVLERIANQQPFIRGYTVSGGECGLYPDFLIELMSLSKGMRLTAMLDSNGNYDLHERQRQIIRLCDGMMLDIKGFDPEIHREITGYTNEKVLATAEYAASEGKLYELRTVCIPGKTDAETCIKGMAELLGSMRSQVIYKLIAFRQIGVKGEYASIPEPEGTWLDELVRIARGCGYKKVVLVNDTI